MSVLDSPLEALAFDYVSFGIFTVLHNLWTWVALLTAAVSFWRIRTGSTATTSFSNNCIDSRRAQAVLEPSQPVESAADNQPSPSPRLTTSSSFSNTASSSSTPWVFEDDGITKGKFVTYFEDDRGSSNDGLVEADELTVVREWGRESACQSRRPESWERIVEMRMGGMRWYRCLDLTAINGNVIRLWDEGGVSIW